MAPKLVVINLPRIEPMHKMNTAIIKVIKGKLGNQSQRREEVDERSRERLN